ncbi:MAG TPA: inositol monophosphatase [Planctomycetaceae bacterium]|nr:inositol monophosphatase [Planctomycetaceae bacterium]
MLESLQEIEGGRWAAAVELARLGGQSTLDLFGTQLDVQRKGDNSPVTLADQRAEQLIRSQLAVRFPEDGIIGEEFGQQAGTSEYQWIVDPIDGTKSFICGVPLYSTLVAVVRGGKTVIGVIYIPALDEMVFAATGHGAWHVKVGQSPERCQVSKRALSDGAFLVSQSDLFARLGRESVYKSLEAQAYVTRTWGDGYGYLLVATGRAELMVDPIANPWDLAAVQVVVQEAGGRFTDWQGNTTAFGGNGIGSNGIVHDHVLQITTVS